MRKLTLLLALVLTSLTGLVHAQLFREIPRDLNQAVYSLYNNPETASFLNSLEKDGPISLKWEFLGNNGFQALWLADKRVIVVNASKQPTEGKKISSVLFELHNSQASRELMNCDQLVAARRLTKDQYVESIERIEFQNVLKTSSLLEKGIASGYFPQDAYTPWLRNFDDHFRLQIQTGHSGFIAHRYDEILKTSQHS